jgi:hypothetical protein
MTEDWVRSLLHYNIKHDKYYTKFEKGFSEEELKGILYNNFGSLSMNESIQDGLFRLLKYY